MIRRFCLALLILLATVYTAKTALAQNQCLNVLSSDIVPIVDVGSGPGDGVIAGVLVTGEGGNQYRAAEAHIILPYEMRVVSVDYDWIYSGTQDEYNGRTYLTLFIGSQVSGSYVRNEPVPSSNWHNEVPTFAQGPSVTSLVIGADHRATTSPDNAIGIRINSVCGFSEEYPTDTPIPAYATATLTPSPTVATNTPAPPTNTPTNTAVPPTNTPGGPTETITTTPSGGGGTATPGGATVTAVGGVTASGFQTPKPPQGCDPIFPPCKNLPLAVPNFATLSLPSPTGLATSTLTTPTLLPVSSATTTGTAGPGTGTPTLQANGIAQVATQISNASFNMLQITPSFNDINGDPVDVANGANQIGANIGEFFGFIRSLGSLFLGRAGTILAILFLCFVVVMLVRGFVVIYAMITAAVKWILKVIAALKPI